MAKKKAKPKSSSSARQATARQTIRPAPAAAAGDGPNRQARKEEARRQREALRRKIARRRYYRIGAAALATAVAIGAVAFVATRSGNGEPATREQQALLRQAPQAADAAGCGEVTTVAPYSPADQDQAHPAQIPPLSTYPSVPPVSGPHNAAPLPAGVYDTPPPIDQAIHSLEHGAAIIWYDPQAAASSPELTKIQSFFRKSENQDHVIVAPYRYPGANGTLPSGKQMAVVAWHHVRSCDSVSLPVAFDFVAHYRFPPVKGEDYRGDAPEQGAPI